MTKIETQRGLTIREWADMIRDEVELLLVRQTRTCMNCANFERDSEICRLAGVRPPIKIAVVGCEKHEEDIPF